MQYAPAMTHLRTRLAATFMACLLSPALALADDLEAQAIDSTKATDSAQDQPTAAELLPLEDLQAFTSVFGRIRAQYVEEIDDTTLLRNAIRGMLEGLDPHSVYLDTSSFENLQEQTKGEFGGLGMEVGMENGFVRVIAPIDDTPAFKAGVQSGDLIIKLDSTAVKGLSLQESVELMRGKPGTDITITVVREGGPPFEMTLTRAIIEVRSVRQRVLEPGYGYLRISQFQSNTGNSAAKAIKKLQANTVPLQGLVLDLRNNPGGVLTAAVDISDLFLGQGTVVYTEGREKKRLQTFDSKEGDATNGLPIVVLINGGSASASEIVAGALQDRKRAVVVGTRSFGKGSVQSVIPLSREHGMKLTTALYFTPNGRSIQAKGIEPDIQVKPAKITAIKPSILRMRENDLNKRLGDANTDDKDNEEEQAEELSLAERDNQLYEALNMLKSMSFLKGNDSTHVPAEMAAEDIDTQATKEEAND